MKDDIKSAKVLATSLAFTKKEIQKLREDFKTSKLNETKVIRGPKGDQGPQGPKGESGPDRKIVVEAKGPVGPKGDKGDAGKGVKKTFIEEGKLNVNFTDGTSVNLGKVIGPRGGQGVPGQKGEQGLIGETGPQGPQGDIGVKGSVGPRGLLGEQGPEGPQGPIGIQGDQGVKGDKGEQGEPGIQGIQGPQGLIGPRGEKGETGPTGLQGPQGPSGKDGTSVDLKPLKDELQVDLQSFKDNISASVSRRNLASGGAGGGIGPRPKTTLHVRDIIPESNVTFNLGSSEKRFKDLFLSGNTLSLGTTEIKTSADGGIELPAVEANTMLVMNPASYQLFTTKVITKTSAHPYTGQGSSLAYSINGKESPSLILVPNMTYRFDQSDSSNGSHPLRFYKDAAKGTSYNTGVSTSGTAGSSGAYVQIAVTETTPTLFYQCSSHGYMGSVATTTVGTVQQQDITDAVNDLIDAAPSQLNTLNELAAALGDDSNFATATTLLINDRMQVANTNLLVNDRAQVANVASLAALGNTNSSIATQATRVDLINTNLVGSNTALRTLINDRAQVANVASLAALANTNLAIGNLNTNLTGSNTALRLLISDRAQVANVASLAALANTNSAIGNLNTNLAGTNTAIRLLVSDRLQVANANATFTTKAYAAANSYVNSNFVKSDATNISFSGQSVTISGNLIVQGTTTQTTTSSSNVESAFMILNAGLTGTPNNNAGIKVNRGNQSNVEIRFNETSNQFEFTNDGTTFNQLGSVGDSLAFAIALG